MKTPTLNRFAALSFCAAAGALAVPGLALADEGRPVVVQGVRADGTPVAHVTFAGLDLASATGRQMLNSRIRRAASNLCVENGTRDLKRMALGRACFAAALEEAAPQVARVIANYGRQQAASAARGLISLRR